MRTTLDLDPVALEAARQLAAHRAQSIGQIVSELILRGLRSDPSVERRNGFPTLRNGGKPITLEDVKAGEDEA